MSDPVTGDAFQAECRGSNGAPGHWVISKDDVVNNDSAIIYRPARAIYVEPRLLYCYGQDGQEAQIVSTAKAEVLSRGTRLQRAEQIAVRAEDGTSFNLAAMPSSSTVTVAAKGAVIQVDAHKMSEFLGSYSVDILAPILLRATPPKEDMGPSCVLTIWVDIKTPIEKRFAQNCSLALIDSMN